MFCWDITFYIFHDGRGSALYVGKVRRHSGPWRRFFDLVQDGTVPQVRNGAFTSDYRFSTVYVSHLSNCLVPRTEKFGIGWMGKWCAAEDPVHTWPVSGHNCRDQTSANVQAWNSGLVWLQA